MAIDTGSLIEVSLNMVGPSGNYANVWQYRVADFAPGIDAADIGNGWWNHVKAAYRGIVPVGMAPPFRSVKVTELGDPLGDYGTYAIPNAEWAGTRADTTEPGLMPPFTAAGARLTVGSRATRPGQKRFYCLQEGDQGNGVLLTSILTPLNTLMNLMVGEMTLGAPAALAVLQPIVVSKGPAYTIEASQDVTGHVINGYVTSQNSRKYGRGS